MDCCASVALSLEVQYVLLYEYSVTECLRDLLDTRQRQVHENWSLFVKITIKNTYKHVFANSWIYKVTGIGTYIYHSAVKG